MSVPLSPARGVQMSPDWLSFELAQTIQCFSVVHHCYFAPTHPLGAGVWKEASFSHCRENSPPCTSEKEAGGCVY